MDDQEIVQRSFLLSNIPSKTERDNLAKKISELGGLLIDSKTFDESASHVICGKLSRTEKVLGACITGKWILSPKYIEDSHQVQMWLEEDNYEFSISDKNQPKELTCAVKRWKWKNKWEGTLPFADWRVSLYMNPKKMGGFQRILNSGGATVLPLKPVKNSPDVAFVLVDSHCDETAQNLNEKLDLLCIREEYLGDYIIKDPQPDLFDYLLDQKGNKNISSFFESSPHGKSIAVKSNSSCQGNKSTGKTYIPKTTCSSTINDRSGITASESQDVHIKDNPELTVTKVFENCVDIKSVFAQKSRKEKSPLAEWSFEKTDFHLVRQKNSSIADGNKPPLKKRKKNNVGETFSPIILRNSVYKKTDSVKKYSQLLKIYEDNLLEKKSHQLTSDKNESIQSDNFPEVTSIKNESQENTESVCSIPPSTYVNNSTIYGSEGTIQYPSTSHPNPTLTAPIGNSESSSHYAVSSTSLINEVHTSPKHSDLSLSESPSVKKQETLKSSMLNSKKPVQMSLHKFGFQTIKAQGKDSPSKPQPETLSSIGAIINIKKESVTPKKGIEKRLKRHLSNTPDTAIMIDDDNDSDINKSKAHKELFPVDAKSEYVAKLETLDPVKIQKKSSWHLSDEVVDVDDDGFYDLINEVRMLCEDDSSSKSVSAVSQSSQTCETKIHQYCTFLEVNSKTTVVSESQNHGELDDFHKSCINNIDTKSDSAERNGDRNFFLCEIGKPSSIEKLKPHDSVTIMCNNLRQPEEATTVCEITDPIHSSIHHLTSSELNNVGITDLQNDDLATLFSFRSYLQNMASHISSLNEMMIRKDNDNNASTSMLIPQWMQACREMNLHSVALEHGRPDENQRPTTEVLLEFINLIKCEDVQIRNLAFYYLMSWFECNSPISPLSIQMYMDFFNSTSDQTVLSDIFDTLISTPDFEGHHLLLDFIVAVFEVNFWHHVNSKKKSFIKECLLIKCFWIESNQVYYKKNMQILNVFRSVLSVKSKSLQPIKSMVTLLGLISECLRLKSNFWSIENCTCFSDCMISLSVDISREIRNGFAVGDEQSVLLILQCLKPAWLRTLVTASILSNLSDFLVMESIQISNISLASIVTQYFFLLPPITRRPFTKLTKNPIVKLQNLAISEQDGKKDSYDKSFHLKVNKKNGKGETPLHIAAIKNDASRLKETLSIPGVDVNMRDNSLWTPLHEACNHGSYACVELLLNYIPPVSSVFNSSEMTKRVDINAKGFANVTPLHDAVNNNHVDICKLLLKYGGKKLLAAKTSEGYTPLDLAITDEMRNALLSSHNTNGYCQTSSIGSGMVQLTLSNHSLPLSSMYDEVLGTKEHCLHYAAKSDCSWFLSLLTLLISSYIKHALLKGGNSLNEKDRFVLNNLDHHLKLLREHLGKITSSETCKALDFQVQMLKIIATECSL